MLTPIALILGFAPPPQPGGNAFLTYAALSPYIRHIIEHDYGGLQHPNFACVLCDSSLDFFKTFVYNTRAYNYGAYGGVVSGRGAAAAHQRHDLLVWTLERLQRRRAARCYHEAAEPWICGVQIRGPMSDFARAWPLSEARYAAGTAANMVFGISSDFLFRSHVAFPPPPPGQDPPRPLLDVRLLHLHGRRISLADCLAPVAGSTASFRHLTALYLTQCFDLNTKGMEPPSPSTDVKEVEASEKGQEKEREVLHWDAWMPSLRVLYVSGGLFESLDFLVTPPKACQDENGCRDHPQSALEEAYFFNCPISDASALASCPALRVLVLTSHALSDISWVRALPKLHYVDFTEDLDITDLTPLAALPSLEVLRVSGCGSTSLHWALLTEQGGEGGDHGQGGHFCDNLRYLDISGSLFFDDSAFLDERVAARAEKHTQVRDTSAAYGHAAPCVFQNTFPQLRILKMSGAGATQLAFLALDYNQHQRESHGGAAGHDPSSWVLFPELEKMDVSSCSNLVDLSALSHVRDSLRVLEASSISQGFDLPLPGPQGGPGDNWLQAARFAQLEEVNFSSCGGITQLASLAFLSHCLRRLSLRSCGELTSLAGLETCTRLERLDVTLCHSLADISALKGLGGSLRALYASVTAIADINSVFGSNEAATEGEGKGGRRTFTPSPFIRLQDINLADVTELRDVSVLWELPALRRVDLSDCEALRFMEVARVAASTGAKKQQKKKKKPTPHEHHHEPPSPQQQQDKKDADKWLRDKRRWIRQHCKLERINVRGCDLSPQSKEDIHTYVQPAALEVLEVFTSDEDETDDLDTLMA